ncbi:MAG: hypothetical protein WC455_23410 [Dehalococcoidia bacterium]
MAKLEDGQFQRTQNNPKMLAEKAKNRARRLPGKYTVKTGDSWTKIAEKIYGPVFQDNFQAQRMAEQLARANPKVGGLRPGTVVRIARPRRNAFISQAFLGDTGPAPTPTAPAYTGAAPQGGTQGTAPQPTVNYNAGSYQGRPWAQGGNAPAQMDGVIQPTYLPGAQRQPGFNMGRYNTVTQPSTVNPYQSRQVVTGAGTTITLPPQPGSADPVYPRTYLPGQAPTQPAQGLGYRDYNQPATVTRNWRAEQAPPNVIRNRRQPGGAEREGNDRGMLATFNENAPRPDWTTDVWERIANTGKLPLFIWGWDAENAGITPEILGGDGVTTFGLGYWQDPMTGNWILRSGTPTASTSSSSTGGWSGGGYSGGYSPGFRGGGGGTSGGGYGGYTGYGGGAAQRAQGYPTEAARMIREAGIGLISWRI